MIEVIKTLRDVIEISIAQEPVAKKRSILELEGLGAEIWAGADTDAYPKRIARRTGSSSIKNGETAIVNHEVANTFLSIYTTKV